MPTFTCFCQHESRTGTTWISTVQALDSDSAACVAVDECAADWEADPSTILCIGIAEGTVNLIRWDDED